MMSMLSRIRLLLGAALFVGVSAHAEQRYMGNEGHFEIGPLLIDWRLNSFGSFPPEVTLRLENRSGERVFALVGSRVRVCGGKDRRLRHEAYVYEKCEIAAARAVVPVDARGTNAIALSIGGKPEEPEGVDCVAEVEVTLRGESFVVSVPVPDNGWGPPSSASPEPGSAPVKSERVGVGSSGTLKEGTLEVAWRLNAWSHFHPDLSVVLRNLAAQPRLVLADLRFDHCGGRWEEPSNSAAAYYGCRLGSRNQVIAISEGGWNAVTFPLGRREDPPSRCTAVLTLTPVGEEPSERFVLRVPVAVQDY